VRSWRESSQCARKPRKTGAASTRAWWIQSFRALVMNRTHDRGVVVLAAGASLDRPLASLKRQLGQAQVMGELRRHAAYLSPGVRRRLKSKRARARDRRRAAARAVTGRPSRAEAPAGRAPGSPAG